jgi:ABC-type transport system involved in Fe-S cluster assembly fused permease/ATPase subunit
MFTEVSIQAFSRVNCLPVAYHLNKKAGEVLFALGQGSAISGLTEKILFAVFPVFVDFILVSHLQSYDILTVRLLCTSILLADYCRG